MKSFKKENTPEKNNKKNISPNEPMPGADSPEDIQFWSEIEFVVKNKNLIDALEIAENLPLPPQSKPKPWFMLWLPHISGAAATIGIILLMLFFWFKPQQGDAEKSLSVKEIPVYQNTFVEDLPAYQTLLANDYMEAYQLFQVIKDSLNIEYGALDNTIMPYFIELYQGIAQMKLENYDQAIVHLESLTLEENGIPDHPENLYLGLIYFSKGEVENARKYLSIASNSTGILSFNDGTAQVITIAELADKLLKDLPQ